MRLRLRELARLGTDFRERGEFAAAALVLGEAVTLAEGLGDPVVHANTLNELGVVCKALGRYDEARRLYQRALVLIEGTGSPHDFATIYHNIGGIEHARGSYRAAETFARRAVSVRAAVSGSADVRLQADKIALAAILDELGQVEEAENLYLDALTTLERQPVNNAGDIAVACGNLGAQYVRRAKYVEAESLLERSLALKRQVLGARHPDVAVSLNNLAELKRRQGDCEAAASLLDEAAGIFDGSLGVNHPLTIACQGNRTFAAAK